MLHKDRENFEQIILKVSEDTGIDVSIVEKDYYVTLFLKRIVEVIPNIIFKGGTSLSKCYKIIKRFSEDIDLNIEVETRPTEGQRKKLKEAIVSIIDEFGFNTIIVRSHPSWIPDEKSDDIIRRLIDLIIEKGDFNLDQFIWRMAATTACRMSVMAGDYISKEDQEWILENIRYCDNPFTCPHGRPTIITYTRYELEKLFKRQLD